MLEPRRLAARAAATRMAGFLGEAAGQTVGYRTRLDSAISFATRVEVVTEGLLVRRLQRDPGLDGVSLRDLRRSARAQSGRRPGIGLLPGSATRPAP